MRKRVIIAVAALAGAAFAGQFKAGFARLDVTPDMGTPLSGYFSFRAADGVLDPLEATCVAVSDGDRTALLVTIDHLHISNEMYDAARAAAAKAANVAPEAVYIAATHTHLGPCAEAPVWSLKGHPQAEIDQVKALVEKSNARIIAQIAAAGAQAVADLAPAKIRLGRGAAPGISYVRRYKMKDGSTRTNPGTSNPNIDHPIGTSDPTVQLVRFVREGRPDIGVVNFQTHPDTIGGTKCSADWPGFLRRTLETSLQGEALIAVFNGAQGDTNTLCYPPEDFVPPESKYANSRRIGRKLAGVALGLWDYSREAEAGAISYKIATVKIPAKKIDPSQLELYQKIRDLHFANKHAELVKITGSGMQTVTRVAEAIHALNIHRKKITHYDMPVSCVAIGRTLAFGGFPGEPFTELGRTVKKNSKFRMTIPTCTTNGSFGYLPEASAYEEGGYEQRSSRYDKGVGELLAAGIGATLDELYK